MNHYVIQIGYFISTRSVSYTHLDVYKRQEVGHAQGEVGVGEELHRLGLRAAEHEPGDADRAVRVPAGALGGVRAFLEQRREPLGGGAGAGVALGRPHHYAAGVQVVVQGPALAEELRGCLLYTSRCV